MFESNIKALVKNQTLRVRSIGKKADEVVKSILQDFGIKYVIFEEKDLGNFKTKTYKISLTPLENVDLSKNIIWAIRNYHEDFMVCCTNGNWMDLIVMDRFC